MITLKRLTGTALALGLAATGLVGFGAGSAQAAEHCAVLSTKFGARIQMCANEINANYLQMKYNVLQRGSTDERAWFLVDNLCGANPGAEGSRYDWISYNDYDTTYDTPEKWCDVANGGFSVLVRTTESGNDSTIGGSVILL
jgi:hypothetical protein